MSAQTSRYDPVALMGLRRRRANTTQDVLEIRTKNIQASRSRTEAFVSTVGQHSHVSLQQSASPLYGTPNRGSPAPNTDLISLNPIPDQQMQMQMMEEGGSNQYIQQRGQAIEAIEATINELGSIFGQLASMVSEQSEMIQRIDANTYVPMFAWISRPNN